MKQQYDVVIIGGGITGLSIAYYLTSAKKKVLLLERKEFGAGASSACDDMIFLQSKKPGIMLTLALESLDLYHQLEKELPFPLDLETRGGMVLIEKQEQLPIMTEFVRQQKELGLKVDILEKKEFKKYQPHVSPHVLAATYSPMDSQVNPLKVMRSLAVVAHGKGLQSKKGTAVTSIDFIKDYNWKTKTEDGQEFCSEFVINAAGAWGSHIAELIGLHIPIRPKRGQIAVTEQIPCLGKTNIWSSDYIAMKLKPELAQNRKNILNELGIGLAMSQTSDGNYFIGGTREFVGFDTSTTFQALHLVIQEASRFLPILKNVHIIRSFAGLRPASPDGKPFIGSVPQYPGFLMAAGHEGDGISLAPVTGKIITYMVTGQTIPLNLDELSPTRLFEKQKKQTPLKQLG